MTSTNPDPYRVLQVDPAAEDAVIHAAYRALARRFHPDGDAPDPRRMLILNAAYEQLRDPSCRAALDAARRRESGSLRGGIATSGSPPRRTASAAGPVLDFGRYAGWCIGDLVRHDPDYLRWLCRHSSGLRYRSMIARLLPDEPDLLRRSGAVA